MDASLRAGALASSEADGGSPRYTRRDRSAKVVVHGARSVITHGKAREPWLERLLARRPFSIALVALANKMARTIRALLAQDRTCQKGYAARAA